MESESRIRGDIKIAFTMLALPTFTRLKKVGMMTDSAMRTADIMDIVWISPLINL